MHVMARRSLPTQSLASPDLGDVDRFRDLSGQTLQTDVRYEDVLLSGDYNASQLAGLTIGPAVLNRLAARAARWRDLNLTDVRLTGCDLANIDCVGAALRRVELMDGRLTGASLSESRLSSVRFVNCKIDAGWFVRSVFVQVRFERCDLRGANFEGADLRGVALCDCDLRRARLTRARLESTDLRGSNLEGIEAGPGDVRGAIIEPLQAADLINLLGVTLRSRNGGT